MNCTRARRELENAADAGAPPGAAVREHLVGCPACRLEAERLEALASLLAAALGAPASRAPGRALEGAIRQAAVRRDGLTLERGLWAGAMLLALVAGFLVRGLLAGPAPAVEAAPARIVRVEVPVIREKVVERVVRQPVVRVRRIYLRPAAPATCTPPAPPPASPPPAAEATGPALVAPEALRSLPPPEHVTYRESIRLARLAGDSPGKDGR